MCPRDRIKPTHGTLDACRGCSGSNCCGRLRQGGKLEPPFLTARDVMQIQEATGLPRRKFSQERLNPATGNTVLFMATRNNKGCIFFNKADGSCGIHSSRPLDCRLFPLDVEAVGGQFYWVRHNYEHCDLSRADRKRLLRYGREALPYLEADLNDYGTVSVPGMETDYTVMGPVRGP